MHKKDMKLDSGTSMSFLVSDDIVEKTFSKKYI